MITYNEPWLEKGETLVCFGDSLTASKTGYVAILAEKLADARVEVVNAGRGGDKTPWALTRLETDVIARKPSAVSIFLGTNDCAVGRGCWADEPRVPAATYGDNLRWIIHLCRIAGIMKFSVTPPLHRFEGKAYREHGDVMAAYCQHAREAADDMRARFVPADIALAEARARHAQPAGLVFTTDGTHLTPDGNLIVAETMLKAWGMA
jgi:lysophospholipase L1-like esterase